MIENLKLLMFNLKKEETPFDLQTFFIHMVLIGTGLCYNRFKGGSGFIFDG